MPVPSLVNTVKLNCVNWILGSSWGKWWGALLGVPGWERCGLDVGVPSLLPVLGCFLLCFLVTTDETVSLYHAHLPQCFSLGASWPWTESPETVSQIHPFSFVSWLVMSQLLET